MLPASATSEDDKRIAGYLWLCILIQGSYADAASRPDAAQLLAVICDDADCERSVHVVVAAFSDDHRDKALSSTMSDRRPRDISAEQSGARASA